MRYTYFIYLLTTLVLNVSQLTGQVSGYMGKRLLGKYDTYTNIYYPLSGKTPDNPFSVRHFVGLDYTIARNVSTSIMFTFSEPIFFSNDIKGSLYNTGIAIESTIFSDDGLAPLGYYVKYQLHYYISEYSISVNDNYYDIFGNQIWGKVKKKGDMNNLILGFVMGQSIILLDRLYLNYGFQLGYRFGTLLGSIRDIDDFSDESEIRIDIRRRNFMHNLWGVQFGVGYLIF